MTDRRPGRSGSPSRSSRRHRATRLAAAGRTVRTRLPGLRPNAPRRNVLVVLCYLLAALVASALAGPLLGLLLPA